MANAPQQVRTAFYGQSPASEASTEIDEVDFYGQSPASVASTEIDEVEEDEAPGQVVPLPQLLPPLPLYQLLPLLLPPPPPYQLPVPPSPVLVPPVPAPPVPPPPALVPPISAVPAPPVPASQPVQVLSRRARKRIRRQNRRFQDAVRGPGAAGMVVVNCTNCTININISSRGLA